MLNRRKIPRVASFILCLTIVHCYCPNGWIRFDDSCYLFDDTSKVSWNKALNNCVTLNSDLVAVDHKLEHNFIKAELAKLHPQREDQFWTAGNDIQIENDWVWVHTNERVGDTFWAPGEPNQYSGNEDCLAYYTKANLEWNDEHCSSQYFYICELDDSNPDSGGIIIG